MTAQAAEATAVLHDVGRVRARTRLYRSGHWFAALVFGAVVFGALPFYLQSLPAHNTATCRSLGRHGAICSGVVEAGTTPFGEAFRPFGSFNPLGSWATLYWAAAIVLGFTAVMAYYHLRARKEGVCARRWPAVAAGLVILGLVMWVNSGPMAEPADFWVRGTSSLVVIGLCLLLLSTLEQSGPYVVFTLGFLALAVLSCLYTLVNVFDRIGIGGPFAGDGNAIPNLVVPGAYLVIGGLLFLLSRRRQLHRRAQGRALSS